MANIFAGFTILWDQPYRLGDTVTMAGNQGQVSEIGLRSTRIRTFDQREVILPNKLLQELSALAKGESGVTVELRVWVADPLASTSSRFLLLEVAKRAMEEAGLEIPFPQRVVRVIGDSAGR